MYGKVIMRNNSNLSEFWVILENFVNPSLNRFIHLVLTKMGQIDFDNLNQLNNSKNNIISVGIQ